MAAEIKEATGFEVTLIPGGGGIYEVRRDGEVLWKKTESGVFPKPGDGAALFA